MSLLPNPSHLEAVNPVVLGKVRATQTARQDCAREQVLPVLLHGDAAFAGQGIIMECFGLSGLQGYNTGGTIHFVINHQEIGRASWRARVCQYVWISGVDVSVNKKKHKN